MCGGTDLMKQDGVFVCQSCGCKYSPEEARKIMIEGPVDISGSTVKIDAPVDISGSTVKIDDTSFIAYEKAKRKVRQEVFLKEEFLEGMKFIIKFAIFVLIFLYFFLPLIIRIIFR